ARRARAAPLRTGAPYRVRAGVLRSGRNAWRSLFSVGAEQHSVPSRGGAVLRPRAECTTHSKRALDLARAMFHEGKVRLSLILSFLAGLAGLVIGLALLIRSFFLQGDER